MARWGRWTSVVFGIMVSLVSPVWAQYRGQMAVGLGGTVTAPTQLDTSVGFGLIGDVTYFLSHRWSAGLGMGLFRTGGGRSTLRESFIGFKVGLHFDLGRWHPFFQTGLYLYEVRARTAPRRAWRQDTDLGVHFGVGVEYFLRPTMGIRWTLEGHDVFTTIDAAFIQGVMSLRLYF